ncbi:MAG: GGDEF domain-containing protein [Rectinemataceae bacterium]
MGIQTALRLEINILTLAVLAVVYISSRRRADLEYADYRIFMATVVTTALILVFDLIAWTLAGVPGTAARIVLYLSDSLYFAFHMAPPLLYMLYVLYQLGFRDRPMKIAQRVSIVVFVVCAALALSSPWTGFIFSIDPANRYHRGPGYLYLGVILYTIVIYPLVLMLIHGKRLPSRARLSLFVYPLGPLVAATLQTLFYGTVLLWPATAISILIVFVNVQNRKISTDYLTGVYNRYSLGEYLYTLTHRGGIPAFSGISVDLDGFKAINDTLGHATGDQALEEAAVILHGSVRRGDFIARYGGDEFTVILETADPAVLDEVARRIRRHFESSNEGSRRPYRLSVSLGSGIYDHEKDGSVESFLSRIDLAMYDNKSARKISNQTP